MGLHGGLHKLWRLELHGHQDRGGQQYGQTVPGQMLVAAQLPGRLGAFGKQGRGLIPVGKKTHGQIALVGPVLQGLSGLFGQMDHGVIQFGAMVHGQIEQIKQSFNTEDSFD